VARGVASLLPSYVDHASGAAFTDVDGREWIDFGAGVSAVPRVRPGNRQRHLRRVRAARKGRVSGIGRRDGLTR